MRSPPQAGGGICKAEHTKERDRSYSHNSAETEVSEEERDMLDTEMTVSLPESDPLQTETLKFESLSFKSGLGISSASTVLPPVQLAPVSDAATSCLGKCKAAALCYTIGCQSGEMRVDGWFSACAGAKGECDACYPQSACGMQPSLPVS